MLFINIGYLLLEASTLMPYSNITVFVLLILVLLFLVAISAAAEVAFFTLSIKDINYLKTKGLAGSKQALKLLDRPAILLAGLRASKYMISILIVLLSLYLIQPFTDNLWMSYGILILALTFMLLLFGEILPKVYARENNFKMALFSAPIVSVLVYFFKPAARLMVDTKAFREDKTLQYDLLKLNPTEFTELVQLRMGQNASKEEIEMFRSILKFGNITVKQIMLPRLEIDAIRKSWDFKRTLAKIEQTSYSRMPVYEGGIDNIVGVVYSKDLLPFMDMEAFDWHSLIRPVLFVHDQKPIGDLLQEFQQKRNHFAIVVDEFGGTSGVVTLVDVMEEIIGDIRDEFDEEVMNYKKIDDQNYIFEGRILINDMCRIMSLPNSIFAEVRGDSDSLAGLILEIVGKFPKMNQRISYKQFDFTILSVDEFKINSVKIEIFKDKSKKKN